MLKYFTTQYDYHDAIPDGKQTHTVYQGYSS